MDMDEELECRVQDRFRNTEQVMNPSYFDDFTLVDDNELFVQMQQIEMEENNALNQMQDLIF